MPTMPFGGFDPQSKHMGDDPWENLETIMHFLEDGEAVPSDLASWLGQAVAYAKKDPDELLRRLGLKHARGRKHHRHSPDAWSKWGERLYRYEKVGKGNASDPLRKPMKEDDALTEVEAEYQAATGQDVHRSQLQEWREKYRAGRAEANAAGDNQ